MKLNQQRRDFNRDGNLGRCRRVERRGVGLSPQPGKEYRTPLERRVDEIIRSRPRART